MLLKVGQTLTVHARPVFLHTSVLLQKSRPQNFAVLHAKVKKSKQSPAIDKSQFDPGELEELIEHEINPFAFDDIHDENERYEGIQKKKFQRMSKEKKFFKNKFVKDQDTGRVLTMEERNQVRLIYFSDPEAVTIEDLAVQFGVKPTVIKKILKNRVQSRLSYEEMKSRIQAAAPKGEFSELVSRFIEGPKTMPLLEDKEQKQKESQIRAIKKSVSNQPNSVKNKDIPGSKSDKTGELQHASRIPDKSPFTIDQNRDGHEEAYIYSEKQGYEYPYGLMSERAPDHISHVDCKITEEGVVRKGDSFYDAETGEFLYRVPGLR